MIRQGVMRKRMIQFFYVRRKERRDKGGAKWDEEEDYIVKGGRVR